MLFFNDGCTFRSYSDQANGMKLLDNLVDKLDNETKELKRLANETNQRIEELKTAVIQVNYRVFSRSNEGLLFLDIGFT